MKKKLIVILAVFTLCAVIPSGHIHDDNCGYDPETDSGCIYEISASQETDFGN